jgi:methyl-accepting chemotaxis protein
MKWNLRQRILSPTIALIIVLTVAVGGTAHFMGRAMLAKAYEEQLRGIGSDSVKAIENWVDTNRKSLALLAADPECIKTAAAAPAEREALAEAVSAACERAAASYACSEGYNLTDAQGLVIASSQRATIGKINVGDRDYVKQALAGKSAISEVIASRLTGNPVIVLAVPVRDSGGAVRGVMFSPLDLNWFSSRFLSDIKVLNSGYAFLYDAHGMTIAHKDTTRILKSKLDEFEWGRKMLAQREGIIHYAYQGLEKKVCFRTSEALGWGVAVSAPMDELNAPLRRMSAMIFGLGGGILLLAIGVMVFAVRSITRPIQRVTDTLSLGADQTTSAATQVSSSSQSLAEGASTQAASIEETSSSLEEMSSMTKRNAESAEKATALAKQTRDAAEKGSADMASMSGAMEAIKGSSDDISKIIKTIDEIAFQTNILALNAAVEAARAGEAGMGFAVVAEEVRSLAQRSAQAAKETATKIEDAIAKTHQGVEISAKVGVALDEIVTRVRQVDELVAEVAGASKQQSQGIDQVNQAVGQMDKVTQSNAASAEESASAAEELNAQAETMRGAVKDLMQLVGSTREAGLSENGGSASLRHRRSTGKAIPSAISFEPGSGRGSRASAASAPEVNGSGRRAKQESAAERDFEHF